MGGQLAIGPSPHVRVFRVHFYGGRCLLVGGLTRGAGGGHSELVSEVHGLACAPLNSNAYAGRDPLSELPYDGQGGMLDVRNEILSSDDADAFARRGYSE